MAIAGKANAAWITLYCRNSLERSYSFQWVVTRWIFDTPARSSQIQKLYERHKLAPPLPRNAPPVAGNIMWARQLLRRIELPMKT